MKYFTSRALQPPTFTYTEEDLEGRRVVYHFIIGARTHARVPEPHRRAQTALEENEHRLTTAKTA